MEQEMELEMGGQDSDPRRVRGQKGARERSAAKFVTARATQCLALHAVSLRRGGGARFEAPPYAAPFLEDPALR